MNGMQHRVGGPAVVLTNGHREWWEHDRRHRLDGPAIERADGSSEWYTDGVLHRTDGPAILNIDGPKFWYMNGKLHRMDGPAVEYIDENGVSCASEGVWASGTNKWYVHGVECSESEHKRMRCEQDEQDEGSHKRCRRE